MPAQNIDDQEVRTTITTAFDADAPQALFMLEQAQSEFDVAGWSKDIPVGFLGKSYVDSPLTRDGVDHAKALASQVRQRITSEAAAAAPKDQSYTEHAGKNCYPSMGAKRGESDALAARGLSFKACQERCTADEKCNCISFAKGSGKCWKRTDCVPESCSNATWASAYIKDLVDALPPAAGRNNVMLPELSELVNADCVFSSPLTRALETCLVGLRPLFDTNPELAITLVPALSDKTDAVHYDSMGDSQLDGIKSKTIRMLEEAFDEDSSDLLSAAAVRVEASRAKGEWWAKKKESSVQIGLRVASFFREVQSGALVNAQGNRCQRIVVCTHASIIRPAMQMFWREPGVESYVPAWFHGKTEAWLSEVGGENGASALPAADLKQKKLAELGLVSVRLSTGNGGRTHLLYPRLMLDTRLIGVKDKPCGGEGSHGKRLSQHGLGEVWGKPFCACAWGFACKSATNKCEPGLHGWKYPYHQNVFEKWQCEDCVCAKI